MTVRLRIPELLKKRRMSAYALSQRLEEAKPKAWSRSLVYRVAREGGAFKCLSPQQIEALADAFGVKVCDLFTED